MCNGSKEFWVMVFPYAERKILKPSETKNFFFLWRENPLSYTVFTVFELSDCITRQKKCRQKHGGCWGHLSTFLFSKFPKFMVISTDQGSILSPLQFSHQNKCANKFLFSHFRSTYFFDHIYRLLKDVQVIYVILVNERHRGVGSTFKLGGPLTSRALAW